MYQSIREANKKLPVCTDIAAGMYFPQRTASSRSKSDSIPIIKKTELEDPAGEHNKQSHSVRTYTRKESAGTPPAVTRTMKLPTDKPPVILCNTTGHSSLYQSLGKKRDGSSRTEATDLSTAKAAKAAPPVHELAAGELA